MKERGILFQAPLVRAVLAGTKTQTRRLAELRLDGETTGDGVTTAGYEPDPTKGWGRARPGDRLWVRETWAPAYCSVSHEYGDACYFEWNEDAHGALAKDAHGLTLHYRADGEDGLPAEFSMQRGSEIPWRSPDARAEGMDRAAPLLLPGEHIDDDDREDPREVGYPSGSFALQNFRKLWDHINGNKAPWESNPFVWAVSFLRKRR